LELKENPNEACAVVKKDQRKRGGVTRVKRSGTTMEKGRTSRTGPLASVTRGKNVVTPNNLTEMRKGGVQTGENLGRPRKKKELAG